MNYSIIYIPIIIVLIIVVFLFIKSDRVVNAISFKLDLGGIIFGGLIAIYSLILAFVVIIVWQQYQTTGDKIESETSSLFNVYRSTYAFRDSNNVIIAKNIRTDIDSYYNFVREYEWPLITRSLSDSEILTKDTVTQRATNTIWKTAFKLNPVTEGEKIWYAATIKNLYQFAEARHSRMANKDYHLPKIMWWMLVAGAMVIIIFSMFLESQNKNKMHHLFKVLLISLMIIFSLLLVNMLNHPFNGIMHLSSEPFNKEKIIRGNW